MKYTYGIGAAIVIMGALFKIMMDKIRDSISILSSNLDTLNEVIKDMSDDLKESSKDSVQYKDSMKSLSKNISNLNSKYESVVNALKS